MKYATGEGLAGQADEILVEAQADRAAFLWVKLGGYQAVSYTHLRAHET